MRPLNRHERSGVAIALAMPRWWTVLAFCLSVAIFGPLAEAMEVFIAAGTRLLTASGARKLRAGKRRISNGTNNNCCCFICSFCSALPSYVTVTITGWAPETVCHGPCDGSGRWYDATAGSDLNGTYDLFMISDCCWGISLPDGQITSEQYGGGGSCGSLLATSTSHEIAFCKATSTVWQLRAWSGLNVLVYSFGANQTTSSGDCPATTYTLPNNTGGIGTCLADVDGGNAGSASVTVHA
jgi:hypothetical protein